MNIQQQRERDKEALKERFQEDMGTFILSLGSVLDAETYNEGRWFVSFGSLLYYIRDKNMGIPFHGDFDISILDKKSDFEAFKTNMSQFGFRFKRGIINNVNRRPLQMVFESEMIKARYRGTEAPQFEVDIFFWVKANGYYWHTYDYLMERPKNGIPSQYTFKGTPVNMFKGELIKSVWEEIATPMHFPCQYGALLDYWYPPEHGKPGWFIPDRNFGQSRAEKIVKLKNCKNLKEKLK